MRPPFHLWSAKRTKGSSVQFEHNPSYVLSDLLPQKVKQPYKLRPRAHDYVVLLKNVKNFLRRYLYQLSTNLSTSDTAINENFILFNFFSLYGIGSMSNAAMKSVCPLFLNKRR